ncbi:hypothetical protein Q7A53_05825 [Halobacillus rhizosphaerae]|uniref:hypothetical protein n=1 Tax=Halobacillus rhizosphaerae TaxID=3064889 RepID=UPI00398AAE2A
MIKNKESFDQLQFMADNLGNYACYQIKTEKDFDRLKKRSDMIKNAVNNELESGFWCGNEKVLTQLRDIKRTLSDAEQDAINTIYKINKNKSKNR